MNIRTRLLSAAAAIALPAAMAAAQITAPTPPPVTGAPNTGVQTDAPVPNTTPPLADTEDQAAEPAPNAVPQPVDAATTAAQQAQDTAEDTADAVEADATADAQAQTEAPAPTPAPAPAPAVTVGATTGATAADARPGVMVHDQSGSMVGTVESADADSAVITTGTARADVPLAALGRNDHGLVISVTRAEFEAAVAARTPAPAPGS